MKKKKQIRKLTSEVASLKKEIVQLNTDIRCLVHDPDSVDSLIVKGRVIFIDQVEAFSESVEHSPQLMGLWKHVEKCIGDTQDKND